jgi:integrase
MKTKYNMKTKEEILSLLFFERGSSDSTRKSYTRTVNVFEKVTGLTLPEMLTIAEDQEDNNVSWKNRDLRTWLITYRKYVYENYKKRTAKSYLTLVISVFRHFEITVEKLPYFSTVSATPSIPINPDLLVDRDVLRLCIGVGNPLLKAVVLFMSSSGLAKTDTLNLTLKDYLIATGSNLNQHPIYAVKEMEGKQIIGVWENLRRQKTGHQYYTFSSPESTTAINHYLLTREHLNSLDLPLFDISGKRLSDLFKETNDQLGLGKNGEFSRFATHMLRRYHSTQLAEAGMEEGKIDMLQGRKPRTVLYQSYLKIKTSTLKEDYIKALPYLIIEDVERYKTELELVREENQQYRDELAEFRRDLNDLKKRQLIWEEMK